MKICEYCQQQNPDHANYCLTCGNSLAEMASKRRSKKIFEPRRWNLFWITLAGSLLLSWLLAVVFHLPIFIIGAVLPLLLFRRNK